MSAKSGAPSETKSLRGELGALGAQAPLSQRLKHASVRGASKGSSPPAAAGLLRKLSRAEAKLRRKPCRMRYPVTVVRHTTELPLVEGALAVP